MLAGFKSYLNITSVTKFMFSGYFSGYNELLSFLPQTEQTVTFHRRLASESQAGGTLLRLVFILGEKKKKQPSISSDGRGKMPQLTFKVC